MNSICDPTGFIARGSCAGWTPDMLLVLTIADLLTLIAYIALPILLAIAYRRVGIEPLLLNRTLLLWFVLFIASCGLGHGTDILMSYFPAWRLDVGVHCFTAICSVGAAWATLFRVKA